MTAWEVGIITFIFQRRNQGLRELIPLVSQGVTRKGDSSGEGGAGSGHRTRQGPGSVSLERGVPGCKRKAPPQTGRLQTAMPPPPQVWRPEGQGVGWRLCSWPLPSLLGFAGDLCWSSADRCVTPSLPHLHMAFALHASLCPDSPLLWGRRSYWVRAYFSVALDKLCL